MASEKTKETVEKLEKRRKIAIGNLKDNFYMDLAGIFLAEQNEGYGEVVKNSMHDYLYSKALSSKKGQEEILGSVYDSRQGGKRYTGNFSEYMLLEKSARIMQESLQNVKVKDVLKLMGSSKNVKEDYKEKYLFELAGSEKEEDQKIVKTIFGIYMSNLVDTKIIEALGEKRKDSKKGLEKILTEEPKQR